MATMVIKEGDDDVGDEDDDDDDGTMKRLLIVCYTSKEPLKTIQCVINHHVRCFAAVNQLIIL